MDKETAERALNTEFVCPDLGEEKITVRGYLRALLLTLWEEEESFSGKRPFGNSGWQYDLVRPLVKGGFVKGLCDDAEYDEWSVDSHEEFCEYVGRLIRHALPTTAQGDER